MPTKQQLNRQRQIDYETGRNVEQVSGPLNRRGSDVPISIKTKMSYRKEIEKEKQKPTTK